MGWLFSSKSSSTSKDTDINLVAAPGSYSSDAVITGDNTGTVTTSDYGAIQAAGLLGKQAIDLVRFTSDNAQKQSASALSGALSLAKVSSQSAESGALSGFYKFGTIAVLGGVALVLLMKGKP